ncbi:hypothetical protein BY996DRAFT_1264602 [Phakopsora pachyrhizi]|nr:hypothetical protein BY996DRAFT_1264602 [Phakopsora pachyrhizi]
MDSTRYHSARTLRSSTTINGSAPSSTINTNSNSIINSNNNNGSSSSSRNRCNSTTTIILNNSSSSISHRTRTCGSINLPSSNPTSSITPNPHPATSQFRIAPQRRSSSNCDNSLSTVTDHVSPTLFSPTSSHSSSTDFATHQSSKALRLKRGGFLFYTYII